MQEGGALKKCFENIFSERASLPRWLGIATCAEPSRSIAISQKYNAVRLFIILAPKGIISIVLHKFYSSKKGSENFDANEFLEVPLSRFF